MRRMISGKAQKYIKDLATNHPDPSAEWGGGASYTAGNGIDITNEEISVNYGTGLTVDDETLIIDTNAVATKTDLEDYELKADAFSGDYDDLTNKPTIPAAVSGTNDGTNWTNLTIGSDTYAIPQGSSTDAITYNDLTTGFYKESHHDIRVKIEGTNPIYVNTTGPTIRQTNSIALDYNKKTLTTNKLYPDNNSDNRPYLTTQIGGGYTPYMVINKTNVSNTSDYTDTGYIDQSDIVNSVAKIIINYIKNNTLPTPGTAKNVTISGELQSRINGGFGWPFIYITYTINVSNNNIVTVTKQNTSNKIFLDDFTFRLDTEEITIAPNKIYIRVNDADNILNSTQDSYYIFYNPEKVGLVEQVDKKFIPLVSDIPNVDTTTAGSFNLEANVDSQGGVTYDWATGGGGSSYTFTNGLTESNGTVSMNLWNTGYQYQDNYSNSKIKIYNGTRAVHLVSHNNYSNNTNGILLGNGDNVPQIQLSAENGGVGIGNTDYAAKLMFGRSTSTYNDINYNLQITQYISSQRTAFEINNNHLIYNKLSNSSPYVSPVLEVSDSKFAYKGNDVSGILTPPSADGTYVLKATVSNGVVTYTWVLES